MNLTEGFRNSSEHDYIELVNAQSVPRDVEYGRQLRASREAAQLSQRDVADRMVDLGHRSWVQSTVGRTEAGTRPLRLAEFTDLCTVLGQSASILLLGLRVPNDQEMELAELRAKVRVARRRADDAATNMAAAQVELNMALAAYESATGEEFDG